MTFGTFLVFLFALLVLVLVYFPQHVSDGARKVIGVVTLGIVLVWVLGLLGIIAVGVR